MYFRTVVAAASLVSACTQRAAIDQEARGRDSSGILIVQNDANTVEPTLSLSNAQTSVFGREGPTQHPLNGVVGVSRLGSGVVAIADAGSLQVLLYRADGSFWKTVGRKGSGPGEFQGLNWLGRGLGDTLFVHDNLRNTITVISDTGSVIGSFQLDKHDGKYAAKPIGILPDGSIVMMVHRPPPTVAPSPEPIRFRTSVVRYGRDGRVISKILDQPGPEYFVQRVPQRFGSIAYWDLAFGRRPLIAVHDSTVYVGDGGSVEVRLLDLKGAVKTICRLAAPPVQLTDDMIARYVASKTKSLQGSVRELALNAFREMPVPKIAPAASTLLVDSSGRIWLQITPLSDDSPREWKVFGRQCSFLGRVMVQSRAEILGLEGERVLLVAYGENDEETINVLSLPEGLRDH